MNQAENLKSDDLVASQKTHATFIYFLSHVFPFENTDSHWKHQHDDDKSWDSRIQVQTYEAEAPHTGVR